MPCTSTSRRCRHPSTPRPTSPACGRSATAEWCTPPGSPPSSRACARSGAWRSWSGRACAGSTRRRRASWSRTADGHVDAARAVLATNVFPSLLKRNRLMTVPVYDYVLMTEPLTDEQLASIGWRDRQGIGDLANQFHYYRMTQRQPDPVRRLRRGLPLRPQGAARVREPSARPGSSSRATSSRRSRSWTGCASRTSGRARSTRRRSSRRSSAPPAPAASRTPPDSPGSASARRASPAR